MISSGNCNVLASLTIVLFLSLRLFGRSSRDGHEWIVRQFIVLCCICLQSNFLCVLVDSLGILALVDGVAVFNLAILCINHLLIEAEAVDLCLDQSIAVLANEYLTLRCQLAQTLRDLHSWANN